MKVKLLLSFASLLLFAGMISAQQSIVKKKNAVPGADAAPVTNTTPQTSAKTTALWDVEFNYSLSDSGAGAGNAGVVWTGTEFWVSRWQTDTIYSLNAMGQITDTFTIAGVTGIRGMTTDGTNIYAGLATTTIRVINPATKTATGSITSPVAARHITYDSTANGGAGGFWVGNFNTDIVQISMTGATLNTISAATHGLTGMYGSAIDHWTAGGPYLWIFHQGGTNQSEITRIQLPTGVQTVVTHDVMSDVGLSESSGLAGGLNIAMGIVPGERTIIGVLQGTPDNRLFGYELNDFIQITEDARLNNMQFYPAYTMVPMVHISPINFKGLVENFGSQTLDSVGFHVDVYNSGGFLMYNDMTTLYNMASLDTMTATVGSFTPAAGIDTFYAHGYVRLYAPQVDGDGANDSIMRWFMVSDTTFARDNNNSNGSLGIGPNSSGVIGSKFTTVISDNATSVSFYLSSPNAGDTVSADLYTFNNVPQTIIASTPDYIVQPADTNGVWITMPFVGGPVALAAGEYLVGVNESYTYNMTLGTTTENFVEDIGWVLFGGNPWAQTESYGFARTFFIRLNVEGNPVSADKEIAGPQGVQLYPNPASDVLKLKFDLDQKTDATVSITDVNGRTLNTTVFSGVTFDEQSIDVSSLTNGVYFVSVDMNGKRYVTRINIMK